ncbi:MAG: hypothetical protein DRO11_00145 [Methanobacteriota archaeon]|nr:MAG: hypothetical protein DRO11_00145 [Euryarchaeota archaeon]
MSAGEEEEKIEITEEDLRAFEWEEIFNEFIDYVEPEVSETTLRYYGNFIKRWLLWLLLDGKDPAKATVEDLKKFLERYSDVSKRTVTIAIGRFYAYLIEKGIASNNPAGEIKLRRTPKKLPEVLTVEECSKLITAASRMVKEGKIPYTGMSPKELYEYKRDRNRLLILLMVLTGLRASEVSNLAVKNIDFESKVIRVLGKGRKERIVPMTDGLVKELKRFIKKHKIKDRLFNVGVRQIENIVKNAAKVAGIQKKVTPHTLRHTAATLMIMNGVDISTVQQVLGHESLATTQIYITLSAEHIKEEHRKGMEPVSRALPG